ncbi:MAG: DUF4091 domain-containing protein [Chthonomonadales bacterium]|nr:DUF4091 domain-containing protein [Chthonomonadales bacterium]
MRGTDVRVAVGVVAVLACGLALGAARGAAAQPLLSGFGGRTGGWRLEGGAGGRPAAGIVSVTGTGDDNSYWAAAPRGLRPGTAYRVRFKARCMPGSAHSTVISGLDVCNRDFGVSTDWRPYSFVFTTPNDASRAFARVGQWHLKGEVAFRDFVLAPVVALHSRRGALALGEGERVAGKAYEFVAPLIGEGSNSARVLASHTAAFNSSRWLFTGGSEVVYRHTVPGARHASGRVSINVGYWVGGECVIAASGDGGPWTEVGRARGLGELRVELPASLFPCRELRVRLRGADASDAAGNSAPGALQVYDYSCATTLDRALPEMDGATRYLEVTRSTPALAVTVRDPGDLGCGPRAAMRLRLEPARSGAVRATLRIAPVGRAPVAFVTRAALKAGQPREVSIPYRWPGSGAAEVTLEVRRAGSATALFAGRMAAFVPAYYAADYGHALAPVPDGALWWCEAPYKVSPGRPSPGGGISSGLRLWAARREREHAQLVLRPSREPGPVSVSVSDLRGPAGARIPRSAVEVREVAYVRVRVPTDRTGVRGEWPDPLPPLAGAWRPRAGRNNPLWITVSVPAGARAGDYQGTVLLRAARWRRAVPLRLRVWAFSLPEHTALRSGFGVQPGNIARYHNLRSPGSLEKAWDRYMRAFAKRRLAPYNPMALAPYRVEVKGVRWNGGTRDATRPASGGWSLRVDDALDNASVTAGSPEMMPVTPGGRYRLSWSCQTERPGQPYLVTLGCFDASRQWISGRNIDVERVGDGAWRSESEEVGERIPAEARYVQLTLRPVLWTEKGEHTGTAWFDDVAFAAEPGGPNLVPDPGFEAERRPEVSIDFTDFDRAARRYLDEMGFNSFTIAFMGLPGGRSPSFDHGSFFGYTPNMPEFDALMAQYGRLLQDHLERNGWLEKAYVYWYDEPEEKDYPIVEEGAARLKRYAPKLKRMMTEQFEKPLYGSVDLWCPITPAYAHAPAAERQRRGEEVWWYVCTGPKEPYCTLFIDHPAVELRTWLWQTWKYGVQGILIWETTWWTSPGQFKGPDVQNPWQDPMSYVDGGGGTWGNGDGRFLYPANRRPNEDRATGMVADPVDSLRWEMLGDGVEDWEYYRLLDGLVRRARARGARSPAGERAARLLSVPDAVCRDMTTFSTDPRPLLRHRAALARAIEELTR